MIDHVLNCFKDMFFFTNPAYLYISEFLIDSSELINFNPINQIVNSFLWNLNDYNNQHEFYKSYCESGAGISARYDQNQVLKTVEVCDEIFNVFLERFGPFLGHLQHK